MYKVMDNVLYFLSKSQTKLSINTVSLERLLTIILFCSTVPSFKEPVGWKSQQRLLYP